MKGKSSVEKRARECEVQLEDARSLATDREKLLLANLRELNEVYESLRQKVQEIGERDARIRSFDEILTHASQLSSLGELAASIAHEIKNPLVSIEGFAKRIRKSTDLGKIREYATYIEKESDRLSLVLTRLLDFSRVSTPEREYFDLNGIADDTVLFTEHHLTTFRKVKLTVKKAEHLPMVYADKVHVQQALINLMTNAAQAMPDGGPMLVRTGMEGEDYVWISVTDKGAGVDEENLEKIFEPFFTTKARGKGTGLGLSLTKKLIEANNGRIEVKSVKGQGSTFRLLLPAKDIGR
jgi:two-component system, NtrC family, sensor kinase